MSCLSCIYVAYMSVFNQVRPGLLPFDDCWTGWMQYALFIYSISAQQVEKVADF